MWARGFEIKGTLASDKGTKSFEIISESVFVAGINDLTQSPSKRNKLQGEEGFT